MSRRRRQAQPAPSAKNLITSQDNAYCVGSNGQAVQTADAFSNPLFRLGYGSQSPLEATEYPLTRLTDNYALLNSLYRDNWVVQNVVGLAVDDMLREWYKVGGSISPEYLNELSRAERSVSLRARISDGLRWGRLYGGAVGLILIRGQEGLLDKPLDLETILPGSFAGLYILDRWSGVTPGIELVTDMADPDFGLPVWYSISSAEGGIAARVHHSRIIRFIGRELPYLEKLAELYWGESEVEAIYRDVVAHDNVSANMAALTFRANIDTMEVQNLEQLFSLGSSEQQRRFWNVMQAQSVMRSNFGMQLVNKGDQITNTQYSFAGLSDVYESMCLNLCGASHYPMTKLFGRSPGGMNATGESDLRNYYDYVDTLRESKLRPVLEKLLPIMAMSAWGAVPDNLEVIFPPLWTPTAGELAGIAKNKAETIIAAFQANLFDLATAQKELKKLAEETGMFGSISDEDIEAGKGKTAQELSQLYDPLAGLSLGGEMPPEEPSPFDGAAQDAASAADYSPDQPRDKNGVGLSMILDRESRKFFKRREPGKRAHRSGVRTVKVGGKLFLKVIEGIEGMGFIETPLVFTMTAFNFAVVSWGIRTDKFMTDIQLSCHLFKKGWFIFGCCESIGKFAAIICLYTFDLYPMMLKPGSCFFQEVGRRVGRLLWIGSQKPQTGKFIYGSVLEKTLAAVS